MSKSNQMKNIMTAIAWIAGILMVLIIAVAAVVFQFSIYKKKHGDHMTFIDFMFDSERK